MRTNLDKLSYLNLRPVKSATVDSGSKPRVTPPKTDGFSGQAPPSFEHLAPAPLAGPFQPAAARYDAIREKYGDRQVVLVHPEGPLMGAAGFWDDTTDHLREGLGFPSDHLTRFGTGFTKDFEVNAEKLYVELRELHARTGRPQVIFGNPTTGVDAVVMLLKHPDLLRDGVVDKLLNHQSAFGTPIADRIPLHLKGVDKNRTANVDALIERLWADFPKDLVPQLDRTIYWIVGGAPDRELHPLFRVLAKLLPRASNPADVSDGVNRLSRQQRSEFGTLIPMNPDAPPADHWDWAASDPAADSNDAVRDQKTTEVLARVFG